MNARRRHFSLNAAYESESHPGTREAARATRCLALRQWLAPFPGRLAQEPCAHERRTVRQDLCRLPTRYAATRHRLLRDIDCHGTAAILADREAPASYA